MPHPKPHNLYLLIKANVHFVQPVINVIIKLCKRKTFHIFSRKTQGHIFTTLQTAIAERNNAYTVNLISFQGHPNLKCKQRRPTDKQTVQTYHLV